MAVFGLPKALGLPGLLADPRPWLAAATFLILLATFKISRITRIGRIRVTPLGLAALAICSPVLAFPLAEGITDPPVIALTCLALALLIRFGGDGWRPAVVLGVVCAMKYTAWPALAVLIVMVMARDGGRAAVRFTATALGTAIGLTVALAPAGILHPAAIVANTVAYPLGLTAARSPAASPLPGHLLAALGPAGHAAAIALLLAAGAALVGWLLIAPPRTPAVAANRIALGLTALFALSPATRFGYFCYPLALYGWVALAGHRARRRRPGTPSPAGPGQSADLGAIGRGRTSGRGRSNGRADHGRTASARRSPFRPPSRVRRPGSRTRPRSGSGDGRAGTAENGRPRFDRRGRGGRMAFRSWGRPKRHTASRGRGRCGVASRGEPEPGRRGPWRPRSAHARPWDRAGCRSRRARPRCDDRALPVPGSRPCRRLGGGT